MPVPVYALVHPDFDGLLMKLLSADPRGSVQGSTPSRGVRTSRLSPRECLSLESLKVPEDFPASLGTPSSGE